MKIFQVNLLIIFLFLFASCGGDSSTDIHQAIQKDTLQTVQLDTSSAENFLLSFIKERERYYNSNPDFLEFDISGSLDYSKGNFHILNFDETYDNFTSNYAIVLNPFKKAIVDTVLATDLNEVQQLLNNQNGLSYAYYEGNFFQTPDLLNDDSPDFLLEAKTDFQFIVESKQTICLFDGINAITPTLMIAKSNYSYGQYEGEYDGVKEFFEFSEDRNCIIYLRHAQNGPGEELTEFAHTWRWNKKEKIWNTGFIAGDVENPVYLNYTQKLTALFDENGTFKVVEQCQFGLPGFYYLERMTTDLSDFYVVRSDDDDVGYNCVTKTYTNTEDSLMQLFEIGRGGEWAMMEPNTLGEKEVYIDERFPNAVSIKRDKTDPNLFSHKSMGDPNTFWYTLTPEIYEYIKCEY